VATVWPPTAALLNKLLPNKNPITDEMSIAEQTPKNVVTRDLWISA
jgi:hypothetical protein